MKCFTLQFLSNCPPFEMLTHIEAWLVNATCLRSNTYFTNCIIITSVNLVVLHKMPTQHRPIATKHLMKMWLHNGLCSKVWQDCSQALPPVARLAARFSGKDQSEIMLWQIQCLTPCSQCCCLHYKCSSWSHNWNTFMANWSMSQSPFLYLNK